MMEHGQTEPRDTASWPMTSLLQNFRQASWFLEPNKIGPMAPNRTSFLTEQNARQDRQGLWRPNRGVCVWAQSPRAVWRRETYFGAGPCRRGCDPCPGCCSSSGAGGTGAGIPSSTRSRPGQWHASRPGVGGRAAVGGSPGLARCHTSPWRSHS